MSISKEFMEAVTAGNELRTRIMLSNYMITDPSFRDFDESLSYALKSIPDLVVPHDGEDLNYDVTAWTKSYLDNQSSIVVNNFSNERIDLLRNMCAHIYGKKVEQIHRDEFGRDKQEKPQRSALSKKQVGAVAAGAGAIVAITGMAISSTPLIVVGAAAAVSGGVLILANK